MRESGIQGDVAKYARKQGVLARKLGFGEGWPDFMFLYKGRVMFIEFKKPGEKPEPLQLHMHGLLRLAKFDVHVVDDVDTGVSLIDKFKEKP